MTKLRSFLAGLLLIPVLTLNASPLPTEGALPSLESTRPVANWCWFFYQGRWVMMPC